MSLDVAYGYCTNLTEKKKLDVDKKVRKNQLALKFVIFLPFFYFFSPPPNLDFSPVLEQSFSVEKLIDNQLDSDLAQKDILLSIRGGQINHQDFLFDLFIWFMMANANGFQLKPPLQVHRSNYRPGPNHEWDNFNNDGSGGPKSITVISPRSSTSLEMEKPPAMPQQDYSGLSKSQRRQLADPFGRDGSIEIDGYPRLDLKFNQVEYKTPKHGGAHGLPTNDMGKAAKTEANALALRDSLLDMPNKPNIIWYKEDMFQGGTPRGCNSVNLFDPDTNIIAVYPKELNGNNLLLTTATLTQGERANLIATNGNFLTERALGDQKSLALRTEIKDP